MVNNINSVTPYLSQADPAIAPRSRPGGWAYPDMLEAGNIGCPTGQSCNLTAPPTEDRSQFGMVSTTAVGIAGVFSRPVRVAPWLCVFGLHGLRRASVCLTAGCMVWGRAQWAIVSAPLVLSVDLTNKPMLDRIWPILSNKEAIAVNQHWNGSPGQLLLTDKVTVPSPPQHGLPSNKMALISSDCGGNALPGHPMALITSGCVIR